MYIVSNPELHRCDLPQIEYGGAHDDRRPVIVDCGLRKHLNVGAVIACHICEARYELGTDPYKAGELLWKRL